MSIDMYVGSSQAQASGVNTMCQKQIQGYQQLQQAINQFVMSSAELQGKTYDSAKQYFSAVLNPLAKGGMLLAEATAKACQKFPDDYQSQVDSADLKSSELEEQIQQYQQGIDTANSIIQFVSSSPLPEPAKKTVLKSVKDVKEGQEKAKKKLDKKLKKLLKFDASSPSIFSEIATLESAVNAGAAQAGTCWNGSTGTFTVPKQEDMAWIGEINSYENREKKRAEKEKMEQLEKYNVYAVPCRDSNGKPTIMWLLEDPKSGRKVNNPELLEFLNMKGARLDPNMFQILTLDGFEEKVAGSWRDGVEYFSGKEYTGLQKIGVQGLQGIQDFAESDYAELLRLMGFGYGLYRISTANGPIDVEVKPKVNVVSTKKFKNATLVNGKRPGQIKETSGSSVLKDYSQVREYWKKDIEFKGTKVYQRDAIIDINKVDVKGRSNLQRMEQGLAPLGPDGNPINLHHMTQRDISSIAEVEQSFHQSNSKTIHINPNSVPSGIDRKAFNKWRSDYWKNRAKDFK